MSLECFVPSSLLPPRHAADDGTRIAATQSLDTTLHSSIGSGPFNEREREREVIFSADGGGIVPLLLLGEMLSQIVCPVSKGKSLERPRP